jgi:hypothetical protein
MPSSASASPSAGATKSAGIVQPSSKPSSKRHSSASAPASWPDWLVMSARQLAAQAAVSSAAAAWRADSANLRASSSDRLAATTVQPQHVTQPVHGAMAELVTR